MISDELYAVLKRWLIEATSDNPSHSIQDYGLCCYVDDQNLVDEMVAFWREQGLDVSYPFEEPKGHWGRLMSYENDPRKHLNPRRLAWVRERIAEYDQTLAMYEEEKRT